MHDVTSDFGTFHLNRQGVLNLTLNCQFLSKKKKKKKKTTTKRTLSLIDGNTLE